MNILAKDKFFIKEQGTNNIITIDMNSDLWEWSVAGTKYRLVWSSLNLDITLTLQLKFFLKHRFNKLSLRTISNGELEFLKSISKFKLNLPFTKKSILDYFLSIKRISIFYSFKKFYEFCLVNEFEGFTEDIFLMINEYKIKPNVPYEKVFLNQVYFEETDKKKLIDKLYQSEKITDYSLLINNIILHLAYELAPRPSQFYLLNIEDFKFMKNLETVYASLNLPMSKKRNTKSIERRQRAISKELANKIKLMLTLRKDIFKEDSPLFSFDDDKRLSTAMFTDIIIKELQKLGIKKKSATDLRHNLAQSLADQGASAEIIAEILGHNSTYPARAYIASTPKIAEIKSIALGKNENYSSLIKMMNTGKIIYKNESPTSAHVKGMINNQYIGGIGSCGLDIKTNCPKNPVYSCYTCIKFHPFKDGNHIEVIENLEKQAQYFIDISEKSNDIEFNRPITQLNQTILSVKAVLNKIKDLND
jgi:integrase